MTYQPSEHGTGVRHVRMLRPPQGQGNKYSVRSVDKPWLKILWVNLSLEKNTIR